MSEPDKSKEDIPDDPAGKGIPNGGNAAKSQEVREARARAHVQLMQNSERSQCKFIFT